MFLVTMIHQALLDIIMSSTFLALKHLTAIVHSYIWAWLCGWFLSTCYFHITFHYNALRVCISHVSFPPAYCLVRLITATQGAAKWCCCWYYDHFWVLFQLHCCYIKIGSHMPVHSFVVANMRLQFFIEHSTICGLSPPDFMVVSTLSEFFTDFGFLIHTSKLATFNLFKSFLSVLSSLWCWSFGSYESKVAQGLLDY